MQISKVWFITGASSEFGKRAIDHALHAENTRLRLQLGADAVQLIRDHAQQLLTSLDAWREVAEDTRIAVR